MRSPSDSNDEATLAIMQNKLHELWHISNHLKLYI